ncbi:MAG: OmpA family protein [Gammaproteobacteria bacterium]
MKPQFKFLIVMIGLGMAAASLVAQAQDQDQNFDSRWYITPQYSYVWPDSKENTNNGGGWQLDFGKPISEDWNLEFGVIDYKLNGKSGFPGSFHQTEYGVNGLWFFNDRPKAFSPFLLLGAGFNHQNESSTVPGSPGGCTPAPVITCTIGSGPISSTSSETQTYGTLGLGFLTSPWSWGGAIRFSVQELHTLGNGNFNDVIASIGLQIPLGSAAAQAPAPAPESQPAPAPAPAPAPMPPPAPAQPAPMPVPAPQKIIALPGVEFATNSARLLPASKTTLDDATQTLQSNPGIDAEVAGYTSSTGKAAYNLKLSQLRADVVMKYLVDHGIDVSRLTAKGYGEADPIASNKTKAGRAKNRRVELRVTNQ